MFKKDSNNYQRREHRPVPAHCSFCEQELEPDYKNPRGLKSLLTEKGKIQGRNRTGICLQHQRKLTKAIKKARYMAMLPYVSLVRSSSVGN